MTHDTTKSDTDIRLETPFGWIPTMYLPFLKGEPDLADLGPVLFGPDFGARLLMNVEAVHLMTDEVEPDEHNAVLAALRSGVTRVLNELCDEPARRLMLVMKARLWFGRPVLVHQVLDIGDPFIAIAA